MRRSERYVYITLSLVVILVYFLFDIFIDAYTSHVSQNIIVSLVTISLLFMLQLFIRFSRLTDWKWYNVLVYYLIFSGLVFMTLFFTFYKIDILAAAISGKATPRELQLESVTKHTTSKGGFVGGYLTTTVDGEAIRMECDRVSYFLVKDLNRVPVKFGRSAIGNYFVSRILLPDAAHKAARDQYRFDWLRRHWILFSVIIIAVVIGLLVDKTDKKYDIIPSTRNPKSWTKFILLFTGLVAVILLLWILAVVVYNYFVTR